MKIVFAIHGQGVGGNETTLQALALSLRKQGDQVFLISPRGIAAKKLKSSFSETYHEPGSPQQWKTVLKKIMPDLAVAIHGNILAFASACKKEKIPTLWWCGYEETDASFLKLASILFDSIAVPSVFLQSRYRTLLADRTPRILSGAVDSRRFVPLSAEERASVRHRYQIPVKSFAVGYCARFAPYKNHLTLIRAIKQLERNHPELRLFLMGRADRPTEKAFRKKLQKSCGSKIRFLTPTEKELPHLIASLDLYVSPAMREGFGSALLEAASTGIPVLASESGAHLEFKNVIGNHYFAAGNSKRLAKLIAKHIANQKNRDPWAQHRKVNVCYSIERLASDLNDFFDFRNHFFKSSLHTHL